MQRARPFASISKAYSQSVSHAVLTQRIPRSPLHHINSKLHVSTTRLTSESPLIKTFPDAPATPSSAQILQTITRLSDMDDTHRPLATQSLADLSGIKDQITLEELTCGVYKLLRLLEDPLLLRPLTELALERTREEALDVDLHTLSRLTVILNTLREIPHFYTYPIIITRIEGHLRRGELTSEELVSITVALKQFRRFISPSLMNLYRSHVESFNHRRGSTSSPDSQLPILRMCNLLNSSPWSTEHSHLVRRLMQQLDVNHLELHDLCVAFKITQSQLEPRPLRTAILQRALEFGNKENASDPQFLQFQVVQTLPEARRQLVDGLEEYLTEKKGILSTEDVLLCFKILRQAKVSKSKLCNIYWKKVLDKLRAEVAEQESERLIHHCHRYMNFNNNLGGTYRYFAFERFALDLILVELREGISQFVPSKLARLSSFLIGYGTTESIPQLILDKLIACREQLTLTDCLQLSRGIQVALELRFKGGLPHEFARQIQDLEKAIDETICGRLAEKQERLSIIDANIVMRGLTMRKSSPAKNPEIFQRIVRRYEETDFPITSRIIRDTTMNLSLSRIRPPKLLESFLNYLVEHQDFISGDIAEKILHSCYTLGHDTNNQDALKVGAEIVERDFNFMTGLAIVNSCLALCFYGALSKELMAKVFCIDFIKRLEDEIKVCYSKATYPQKVLNKVMQMNRSVCLDYPEYHVPWFQQNYVEAQTTKSSPNEIFQKDVQHRLKQIFRDDIAKIEINHSTAYGYRLDFLFKLDNLGRLLPQQSDTFARRLAVVLLGTNSYCSNLPTALCGYEQLRQRHLEILGFDVLEIGYREWTSSEFNMDTLREQFIQRSIEIVQ